MRLIGSLGKGTVLVLFPDISFVSGGKKGVVLAACLAAWLRPSGQRRTM
jgi:hypothetical protein